MKGMKVLKNMKKSYEIFFMSFILFTSFMCCFSNS
jgi:hypothetical protein